MRPPLWLFFIEHAAPLILALCLAMAVAVGLAVPLNVWLFTHQWTWMDLNDWLAFVVWSIPLGSMAAGIFTAHEWYQRSDLPAIRKGIITALIYALFVAGAGYTAKEIRVLFPPQEKPEKPATMAKPVPNGWKYVPVEVLPKFDQGENQRESNGQHRN